MGGMLKPSDITGFISIHKRHKTTQRSGNRVNKCFSYPSRLNPSLVSVAPFHCLTLFNWIYCILSCFLKKKIQFQIQKIKQMGYFSLSVCFLLHYLETLFYFAIIWPPRRCEGTARQEVTNCLDLLAQNEIHFNW